MKKLMKLGFMAALMGALVFFTGCDDNEIIVPDPTSDYDGELDITEGNISSTTIFITDVLAADPTATAVKALVTVTAAGDKMKRIYITENIAGTGEEPFELTGTDNKLDGSLDLENSAANEYSFVLTVPIVGGITAGTIEYNIWATSGRGDYRDSSKRLLAGVGTLTINYGGNNPASVKKYTATLLEAPAADGSSATFLSLLDGKVYTIDQGEEFVSFWDFGYFYGATSEASLASTNNYPSNIVDIPTVANTAEALNNAYFALSSLTSTDFAAATASDLSSISTPSSERITNLAVGDIVEFVDNYGKKGLIEVVAIVPGFSPNSDSITINIKIQP